MNIQRRFLVALVFASVTALAPAQSPRIDPAGIPGAILLCGGGKVPDAAIERFIDLAGGEKAKVAVVNMNNDRAAAVIHQQLSAAAKIKQAAEPKLLAWKDAKAELPKLTGIWLITAHNRGSWQGALKDHPLRDECLDLQKRPGIIATSGDSSEIIGERGLMLLPSDVVDVRSSEKATVERPLHGLVAFDVSLRAALLIKGRTLSAVGDEPISILLPSKHFPTRSITLKGKGQEDLTALRRSAHDRENGFPPKKVEPPVVEKGTLVIVGGGGLPDGMFKKFVEYAGGEGKANIVIFPTANESPLPKRDSVAAAFKKAGAKKATVLYGQTQAEVESKEFLDTLKEATGLWFDGGRQWRFVDCYENTKALRLMFDVLQRGGVIGGTSAGATIQGEYLARGGVFNNFDIRYEGYERGLGFLKGVAIDQHFTQRKRQKEMTQLMKIYPQYLGIGLDEATAIVVKGSIADVIGKGKVHFYDANRKVEKGEPDYEALSAGGRYDLKARKVLTAEK